MQFRRARALAGACTLIWLFAGCTDSDERADREHPIVTSARIVVQGGRTAVHLDDAALQRAGIRVEPVHRRAQPEAIRAFATVEDLEPLAQSVAVLRAARTQLESARARLAASHAEYERERQLFEDQRNVSAAHAEAAQAAFLADQAAVQAAQGQIDATLAQARLGWGPVMAGALEASDSRPSPLLQDLLDRRQLLLQVALPAGWSSAAPPQGWVVLDGSDGDSQRHSMLLISVAARADPRLAGRSFLYRTAPDPSLQAGAGAVVRLPTGRNVEGARLPSSALVWWEGRAWIFVRDAAGDFERREIGFDRASEPGELLADLEDGAPVVVQGAQVLLSEELRAENFSTDVGGR